MNDDQLTIHGLKEHINELKAENSELHKDKARLEMVEQLILAGRISRSSSNNPDGKGEKWIIRNGARLNRFDTFREAIDHAMSREDGVWT